MKRIIDKRSVYVLIWVLLTSLTLTGCARYKKVSVTYRRKAIIENLESKKLIIGPFYQKSFNFQAVSDFIRVLQRTLDREMIFREIEVQFDIRNYRDDVKDTEMYLKQLTDIDWVTAYAETGADLLLAGAVLYDAKDRSGYDSEWQENRYGYRVPVKVYRNKLSFDLELGLILVDLATGTILFKDTFADRGQVEGQADEVSVFFDLIDEQIEKFLNDILGEQVQTKRYLLYH
jgi:hypothetical protein